MNTGDSRYDFEMFKVGRARACGIGLLSLPVDSGAVEDRGGEVLRCDSSSMAVHLFDEAKQRSLRGFARGVRRWFVEDLREFLVRISHFHTSDDDFALSGRETFKRPFVASNRFGADCLFEG